MLRLPAAVVIGVLLLACGGDENGETSTSSSDGDGTATAAAGTSPAATESAGGSTPASGDSGGSEDIDTCTLLTADEVEAAIGVAVNDGAPNLLNTCDWTSGDPDEISVTVALISLPGADLCASALADDDQYSEVTSFDDPAFSSYNPAMGGLADIVVCTSAGQLQVIANGGLDDDPNEEQLRGAAEQLAQIALDRM